MPKEWTGNLVGLMHNNQITFTKLAEQLGVTTVSYTHLRAHET